MWEPIEIVSNIYKNGLLVKEWTQTKVNADWEDTKLKEHSYNNNNQLVLYEEFAKPNGVWEVVVEIKSAIIRIIVLKKKSSDMEVGYLVIESDENPKI
ncbi:MAG: hypothetical protein R2784_09535 [Saprospiraceae bacterium]